MDTANFIREALSRPPVVIAYSVSQDLAASFPDKALIQGAMGYFDVESFARAGHCVVTGKAALHNQVMTFWMPPEPELSPLPGPFIDDVSEQGTDQARKSHATFDRVNAARESHMY